MSDRIIVMRDGVIRDVVDRHIRSGRQRLALASTSRLKRIQQREVVVTFVWIEPISLPAALHVVSMSFQRQRT